MIVSVLSVSVWGPGLAGWAAAHAVLAGTTPYASAETPAPPPAILPPNERRRAGPVVRLALVVADEAAQASGLDPAALRSVFASANGDGPVVGGILDALARGKAADGRIVSPTQFGNSVHNAAAGYWSIATGGARPATCLGCGNDTFAAGLLFACAEAVSGGAPVLFVCYDHPMPPPLDAKRPIVASFGVGMVLSPDRDAAANRLDVHFTTGVTGDPAINDPSQPALRPLMLGNPAATSLRLLEFFARKQSGLCRIPYLGGLLDIAVLS